MGNRGSKVRDTQCQSTGECLLRLGQMASFLVRHGSPPDEAARELDVGNQVCKLALRFAGAPDWLKFRALVEEWNALLIRSRLKATNGDAVLPADHAMKRE